MFRIMFWLNIQPSTLPPFQPSSFPAFYPSSLPPFQLSSLPSFQPSSLPAFTSVCWRCDLLFKKDKLAVRLWLEQIEWEWSDGLREEWCRKNYNTTWLTRLQHRREGGLFPSVHLCAHTAAQPTLTALLLSLCFVLTHTPMHTVSLSLFHSLSQSYLCSHTCNYCGSSFRNGPLAFVFFLLFYLFISLMKRR